LNSSFRGDYGDHLFAPCSVCPYHGFP
jgi:hypothetical protein